MLKALVDRTLSLDLPACQHCCPLLAPKGDGPPGVQRIWGSDQLLDSFSYNSLVFILISFYLFIYLRQQVRAREKEIERMRRGEGQREKRTPS